LNKWFLRASLQGGEIRHFDDALRESLSRVQLVKAFAKSDA